ncbi:MAG: autoinducer binding domain-containing protein [Pseudomonadota bacterium]
MQGNLGPFIDRLSRARTLDDLSAEIRWLRDAFEVENLVYHSVNSTGDQYAALTYCDDWVHRYQESDFARIDPVVQGCFRRFDPVDWSDLDWSGKAQRAFREEASAAGVGAQGLSVPIRGPRGQFALFTVNTACSDEAWARYSDAHLSKLILVAHYVNQKALEIERGTDLVPQAALSPRETDTLKMLALGYSRARAADRLSISEHTLRVYIESARLKLGASNTTHAVARALMCGMIAV